MTKDSCLKINITQGYVNGIRSVEQQRRQNNNITERIGLRLMRLYELLTTDTECIMF